MPTIVIVGAGPLLGLAIAKKFGAKGFNVGLIARSEAHLARLAMNLDSLGIEAIGVPADITKKTDLISAFGKIKSKFGSIDVLEFSPTNWKEGDSRGALQTTAEIALEDFMLLGYGAVASAEQVLPDMLSKNAGALFFTTGYSAIEPLPFITSLCISNAGLRSYALCLHQELAPRGIYVGHVSINAFIAEGTAGDPNKIADLYWDMYQSRDRSEDIFSAE